MLCCRFPDHLPCRPRSSWLVALRQNCHWCFQKWQWYQISSIWRARALVMFFAASTTFQSDTRGNVSEEPDGLCFLQLVRHFRVIPERMSLKSQTACYVFRSFVRLFRDTRANVPEEPRGFNMLVPCSTYWSYFSFPEFTALKAIRGLCSQMN